MNKRVQAIIGFFLAISVTGLLFYMYSNPVGIRFPFRTTYQKEFQRFDKEFTDHFPEQVNTRDYQYAFSCDKIYSHPGIWLRTHLDKEEADTLWVYLTRTSIASYDAMDSCLLVVDEKLTEANVYLQRRKNLSDSILQMRDCQRSRYPVPKFWSGIFFETSDTRVGLSPNYRLFVLDAKAGLFMNVDSLPKGRQAYRDWKHGYTKGIALDTVRSSVIFWFDIW